MRLPEEPDQPFQVNILPMIDVVFALLTFFIMSTLTLTRSESLSVKLPGAQTAKLTNEAKPIEVTIDAKGALSIDRQGIELSELRDRIKKLISNNTQKTVLIRADEQVAHGKVVAAMDAVRQVAGAKLAIATQKK